MRLVCCDFLSTAPVDLLLAMDLFFGRVDALVSEEGDDAGFSSLTEKLGASFRFSRACAALRLELAGCVGLVCRSPGRRFGRVLSELFGKTRGTGDSG